MPSIHLTNFIAAPPGELFNLSRSTAVFETLCKQLNEHFKAVSQNELLQSRESFTMSFKMAGKALFATFEAVINNNPATIVYEQQKGDFEHFRYEQYFKEVANGTIVIEKINFGYPRNFFRRIVTRFFIKKKIQEVFERRIEIIKNKTASER